MSSPLVPPVDRFIAELGPVLEEVAASVPGVRPDRNHTDVALEAFNLTCAFVDVDGRKTDDELWGLIGAFGPRFETMLQLATPEDLRKAGTVDGKRAWLSAPSTLFDILLQDDHRRGTGASWRYYELAMPIAHTICSLDAVPSETELRAVERFRSMLLKAMANAGIVPPGRRGRPPFPVQPTLDGDRGSLTAGAEAPEAAVAPEPLPPARPLEELLAEIDELVGLKAVKDEVKLVADLLQVENLRRQRGLPVADQSRHLVFTGNPGTGKTTVARLLAQIYRTLKVVERGHLVETDRSGLVAGYVGQTAIQVKTVVESAIEGVLLIDEAYALARGDGKDFGREAIDTLVKLMEDHRDDVVVIAAGYPEEMNTFVESNPGLRSRFPKTIHFPDYSDDELLAIVTSMCKRAAYAMTPEAVTALRAWFEALPRDKGFGNARLARNAFEAAVARQAQRVVKLEEPTNDDLQCLTPADVVPAPPA